MMESRKLSRNTPGGQYDWKIHPSWKEGREAIAVRRTSTTMQILVGASCKLLYRHKNTIRTISKYYFDSLNVNHLIKAEKLKKLTDLLNKHNILILNLLDENALELDNFRILKENPGKKIAKQMFMF